MKNKIRQAWNNVWKFSSKCRYATLNKQRRNQQCWQTNQKTSGKHTRTHTLRLQTQTGNLGVDPVSAAWLDKGDYPPCGELGARVSVWVCVRARACICVYTDTCFLCLRYTVCFSLMCVCAKCVCVRHCWGELCRSIPRSRKEGLSGFSK